MLMCTLQGESLKSGDKLAFKKKKKKKFGRGKKYPELDEKTRNSDRQKRRRGGFKKLESSVHSNHSRNHLSPTVLFHHTQLAQNTKPELGEGWR